MNEESLVGESADGFTQAGKVEYWGKKDKTKPNHQRTTRKTKEMNLLNSLGRFKFPRDSHFKVAVAFFQRSGYSLPSSATAVSCSLGQDIYYS